MTRARLSPCRRQRRPTQVHREHGPSTPHCLARARLEKHDWALSTSNRSELAWCDTERARLAGEGARVRDPGETWSLSCDAGGPGPTTRVPSV